MSEVKSDLRKACEALYVDIDGVPRCPLCQMPMNGETESHLPDCQLRVLQESYANALVAAAVEASAKCAEDDNEAHRSPDIAERIRSTVTPEAAAKELERIKAEARWEEHLKLCPKCTRKQRDIIGIRCPDAVALEAAARKEE